MATNEQTNTLRRLVLRVGKGSLMFTTTDNQSQVVFEQYPINSSITMAANLREALRTNDILTDSYQRTLIMVDSPVLMVPTDLFREEEKAELYFHAYTKKAQQIVLHSVLPDLNSVVLFSIDKDLLAVINDNMSQPSIIAAMVPVWHHLHQRSYTGTHQKLYGYFHDRCMEVFSFAKNRFKFCNSFDAAQAHDALYYLLYVWKQLRLESEHDELHILGDIPEQEWLLQELKRFLQNAYLINAKAEFQDAPATKIKGMPYDLITLITRGR